MEFNEAYKFITQKYKLKIEVILATEKTFAIKATAIDNRELGNPKHIASGFYSSDTLQHAHEKAIISLADILNLTSN